MIVECEKSLRLQSRCKPMDGIGHLP